MRALIAVLLVSAIAAIAFYFGRATATRRTAVMPPHIAMPENKEPLLREPARIDPPPSSVAPPLLASNASLTPANPSGTGIGLPIPGLKPGDIQDTFNQARAGGERRHEASDIMSSRGTPVVAVSDGVVKKLFNSKPGGLTVYQFDPTETYAYYYSHLDRYADGLKEGMMLRKGDRVGDVGSTGNADPAAPHLHFAIFELGPEKRWYEGKPINPYLWLMANFANRTPSQ